MTDAFDLLAPAAVRDPHALMRRAREVGPIAWSERHRAWIIVGHPELIDAFGDRRLSTERMGAFLDRLPPARRDAVEAAVELLDGWMLFHEPPTHERLRAPLRRSFTPRAVSRLVPMIEEVTDRLLGDLADGPGLVDIVETFAHRLPVEVIGRLFGVPPQHATWLRAWSDRFGVLVFGATSRPDYDDVVRAAGSEFHRRIGDLLDERRATPADDLLTALLEVEGTVHGLSTVEILGACSLLLFAGHDTTASLLGSSIVTLDGVPLARDQLAADPSLWEPGVEELLRLDPPPKVMLRLVAESHEREGCRFERGQSVYMGILGANRDPRVFDSPDEIRVHRSPNPHLSFGFGHHFCLGAALARLEACVALRALYERFPAITLAGEPEWKATIADRSLHRLMVDLQGSPRRGGRR